jgi:hypothetical protein
MRKAISITLSEDNLLWLKGQAARSAKGSVSEVLDRIVVDARKAGRTDPGGMRSVAATIDLPDDDPDLTEADSYVRTLFAASTRQPLLVRERKAPARRKTTKRG